MTGRYVLTAGEIIVLGALADGKPSTSVELAQLVDFHPVQVRSILAELRRRFLVHRGATLGEIGNWTITATGLSEVNARRQLSIIEGGQR